MFVDKGAGISQDRGQCKFWFVDIVSFNNFKLQRLCIMAGAFNRQEHFNKSCLNSFKKTIFMMSAT